MSREILLSWLVMPALWGLLMIGAGVALIHGLISLESVVDLPVVVSVALHVCGIGGAGVITWRGLRLTIGGRHDPA